MKAVSPATSIRSQSVFVGRPGDVDIRASGQRLHDVIIRSWSCADVRSRRQLSPPVRRIDRKFFHKDIRALTVDIASFGVGKQGFNRASPTGGTVGNVAG